MAGGARAAGILERAAAYEADVLAGRVDVCAWVRRACERNARDRARAGTVAFPYVFDPAAALLVGQSIEMMPHVKGEKARPALVNGVLVRQTIHLEPWQAWYVTTLFGWKRQADGLRRFRLGFLSVPRKNAKSTIAAALMDYMLAIDGEPGAEVFAGATKKDQARIVWSIGRSMALKSPGFVEQFGIEVQKHAIRVPGSDSVCEAIASDADNLDGLNTHFAVLDELHAHRSRELYDVIETSMGARLQPMLLLITTAGVNVGGICYELLTYLRRILEGAVEDETYFGVDYTLDPGDELRWHEPAIQRKANPNYGVSVMADDLARLAVKARHSSAAVNNFLIKRLNVWIRAEATSGISVTAWGQGFDPAVTWDQVRAWRCLGIGLDLGQVDDFAAMVAVFAHPDGERWALWGRYYLPEATIAASGTAAYSGWVRDGWLVEVPGQTISFAQLESDVLEWVEVLKPAEVCFDRALGAYLLESLADKLHDDPPVVVVPQDRKTICPAWGEFKRRALAGGFAHGGDPVFGWMVSNVAVKRFDDGEEYPVKSGGKDSPHKIDGPRAAMNVIARQLQDRGDGDAAASAIIAERGIAWLE